MGESLTTSSLAIDAADLQTLEDIMALSMVVRVTRRAMHTDVIRLKKAS